MVDISRIDAVVHDTDQLALKRVRRRDEKMSEEEKQRLAREKRARARKEKARQGDDSSSRGDVDIRV